MKFSDMCAVLGCYLCFDASYWCIFSRNINNNNSSQQVLKSKFSIFQSPCSSFLCCICFRNCPDQCHQFFLSCSSLWYLVLYFLKYCVIYLISVYSNITVYCERKGKYQSTDNTKVDMKVAPWVFMYIHPLLIDKDLHEGQKS